MKGVGSSSKIEAGFTSVFRAYNYKKINLEFEYEKSSKFW